MTYYAYIGHHEGYRAPGSWAKRYPITFIEFVKDRKDGPARIDKLKRQHPDYLPQDGWSKPMHYALDTDDNAVIEGLKRQIRLKLATKSIDREGQRRLWADKPGAPAGCYRLDFYEANTILRETLRTSGLYKAGG